MMDSLLLRGGGFRRRCEQIPAAGRLRENALRVLRQQVASVDQALRRVTYLIEIGGLAGIACRDRPARVAFRCALNLGRAPSAMNNRASAAPCPRAPPLMSMTLPLRRSILSSICLQNVGIPEIWYHAMAAAARRAPSCSAPMIDLRRFADLLADACARIG